VAGYNPDSSTDTPGGPTLIAGLVPLLRIEMARETPHNSPALDYSPG
jgi:hypothetical protein